uniref:RNA polymerase sigma factor n=1 Tax=uncultured Draconibacterium sp. TaxID=1573823 RepID=UPI0032163AC9
MSNKNIEFNDSYLWKEFKNGNQLAFASIYNRYVDQLFKYATKLTSNRELVKDCIQEVFYDLYVRRLSLSNASNLKFYLLKSLKHTIFRKEQRERNILKLNKKIVPDFIVEYSFERELIETEIEEEKKQLVNDILKELSANQKEILYLRFMQELTYSEIAIITNISAESAKKQVYRTVKKIRQSLGDNSNLIFLLF